LDLKPKSFLAKRNAALVAAAMAVQVSPEMALGEGIEELRFGFMKREA
jgi:hypothetical protein